MPPDPPSLIVHTAWPYQSKIAGSGPATACGINPTFQLLGSKQHLPLVVIVTSLWHHKKSPLNAMCALVRPTPDALAFLLVSVKKIAMKSWEELCCWLAPSGLFFHTWLLKFHPLWSLSTVSQSPDDLVKARMMASGEVGNPTNLKNQCGPVPSISYVTSKHSLRSYSMIKFFFQHHANYLLYNYEDINISTIQCKHILRYQQWNYSCQGCMPKHVLCHFSNHT